MSSVSRRKKTWRGFTRSPFSQHCSARSLVRAWGRIGTRGQQMVHLFDNEKQAINLFLDVLREKRKRGYRP